jgi:hypothetical protein
MLLAAIIDFVSSIYRIVTHRSRGGFRKDNKGNIYEWSLKELKKRDMPADTNSWRRRHDPLYFE